jgi:arginine-tRNA-protein transferase
MAYKTRYRPIEVLGPTGWSLLSDEDIAVSTPVLARMSELA